MLIRILAYLPAIVGLTMIGLFVIINRPKDIKNRLFAIFNLFTSLWLLSQFIGDSLQNEDASLWSFRFALFFGQLVPLILYYLVLFFPYKSRFNVKRQVFGGLLYSILAVLSFTSLNVSSVEIGEYGTIPQQTGILYSISDYATVSVVVVSLILLWVKQKNTGVKQYKYQIRLMMFGIGLVVATNILTGIILLTIIRNDNIALLLGDVSLLAFSMIIAYAMVKHGLFSIRSVVARSVAYILSLTTIGGVYSLLAFGIISRVFPNDQIDMAQQLIYILLAIVLAVTFRPTKKFFDKLSNRLFYRDAYDSQELIDQMNVALVNNLHTNDLLQNCASIISRNLKVEDVTFFVPSSNEPSGRSISINGSKAEPVIDELLLSAIGKIGRKVLITDDAENGASRELTELFRLRRVAAVVRFVDTSKELETVLGYLLVGDKRSGGVFSSQDAKVLEILANGLTVAIENALRFEEIEKFNVTLQKKVDDATKELRKTNEKLKELDEAKDEFISMASHQLRTPLTSVKGYVSMVLEGDVGKLSSKQKELLQQSFTSAQRMVYLISDLLNVSRLKTGKFIIEPTDVYLPDVVEGELKQVEETAKSRNVKIEYSKPKKYPTLKLDDNKIRQVIMNFVDNAIYYTPSGGEVVVELRITAEKAEFIVTDNGIGVPKVEQAHLFTKFYRAGNARVARPDGTGLGLFMAKKVIIASGGALIFKSEEGKGSTFGFSFPLNTVVSKKIHSN